MTSPAVERTRWWRSVGVTAPVVAVVAVALSTTAGCSRDDYRSLRVGECLPAEANVVGRREADPPRVDCDEPHRYEVYANTTVDGPRQYPGEEAADDLAEHACYLAFEAGVGFPAEEMPDGVLVVFLRPSPSSWNSQRDREVECLLVFDGDRTGRAVRGTA